MLALSRSSCLAFNQVAVRVCGRNYRQLCAKSNFYFLLEVELRRNLISYVLDLCEIISKNLIFVKLALDMDQYDKKILRQLQEDGRISNLELAEKIHLSPPQTLRRVRNLEKLGIIQGYAARVDRDAIGLSVMAYVNLSLDREQYRNVREIEKQIMAFAEVIECHTISGDFDYMLKVVATDLRGLSQFLTDKLMQVAGVGNLRSMVCMEEIKPISGLPISYSD